MHIWICGKDSIPFNFWYNTRTLPCTILIKIWDKSVKGFLSYDGPSKQTNRGYYFIYKLAWEQTNRDYYFIYKLAWEPSVSWKLIFLYISQHTQLKIVQAKLRTFPGFYRVIHSKFEANQSRGSWVMIGQKNIFLVFMLAWKPNFVRKLIFLYKNQSAKLRTVKPREEHSRGFSEYVSQSEFKTNRSRGSWVFIGQTNSDYYFYIYGL